MTLTVEDYKKLNQSLVDRAREAEENAEEATQKLREAQERVDTLLSELTEKQQLLKAQQTLNDKLLERFDNCSLCKLWTRLEELDINETARKSKECGMCTLSSVVHEMKSDMAEIRQGHREIIENRESFMANMFEKSQEQGRELRLKMEMLDKERKTGESLQKRVTGDCDTSRGIQKKKKSKNKS